VLWYSPQPLHVSFEGVQMFLQKVSRIQPVMLKYVALMAAFLCLTVFDPVIDAQTASGTTGADPTAPNDPSIPGFIRQGLEAKAFSTQSSGIDLNGDGVPEVISRSGCGASNCEWSISDGMSRKEILSIMQTDSVHILPARTKGYHDLLLDGASSLYVSKFNGERYETVACYEWLKSDGSPVPECCWNQRGKLVKISCRTSDPQPRKEEALNLTSTVQSVVTSLGLRSGMSQPQVKAIIIAHGFDGPDSATISQPIRGIKAHPWACQSNGGENDLLITTCASQKGKIILQLAFLLGKAHRDPDTGNLVGIRMDRLYNASVSYISSYTDNVPDMERYLDLWDPQSKACSSNETQKLDYVCRYDVFRGSLCGFTGYDYGFSNSHSVCRYF
jgi:hypothetical protein